MTTTQDWSSVADAWAANVDHVEAMKAAATDGLLERLALRPGDRVLELGAGTGALGLRLADLVQPGGSVLITDVAAGMVALERRRVGGRAEVTVAQVDAMATGLPDASFDVVVFRMGLMFTPDPAVASAEVARLLASGGRAGLMVWAGPEHNPWLACLGMALLFSGVTEGGPPVGPGEVFSLGDAAALQAVLERAGLEEVVVEPVGVEATFADVDDYLAVGGSLAPPLATALSQATPEQLAAVRTTLGELTADHLTDAGLVLPGRALVATATVS